MLFADPATAFLEQIAYVLLLGAEKEMIRIDTRSIVATWAVVANVHVVRNGTVGQDVTHPVGSVGVAANRKVAVPIGLPDRASPQPARISFLYFFPETILNWACPSDVRALLGTIQSLTTIGFRSRYKEMVAAVVANARCGTLVGHHDLLRGVMAPVVDSYAGPLLCL